MVYYSCMFIIIGCKIIKIAKSNQHYDWFVPKNLPQKWQSTTSTTGDSTKFSFPFFSIAFTNSSHKAIPILFPQPCTSNPIQLHHESRGKPPIIKILLNLIEIVSDLLLAITMVVFNLSRRQRYVSQ